MSITIEGLPVLIEFQHQLRNFLADRLPPEEILFARWQSSAVLANPFVCDNAPDYVSSPYPPLPPLSVGEIQWPSGASRYARALYAVDWSTMKEIAKTAWGWEPDIVLIDPEGDPDDPENQTEAPVTDVPDDWGTDFYEVSLEITDGEQTFTANMLALRPFRVTGNGIDLWLLPLVDERWKIGHLAFEPLDAEPASMSDLIDEIADAAGVTIDQETATITGDPDKRIWNAEQPASLLLDVACLSSGLRVVRDPGGGLRAVDAAFSDTRRGTRLLNPWRLLSGGKRGPSELPKEVRVHCRKDGSNRPDVQTALVPGGMTTGGPALVVWSSWRVTSSNASETSAFAAQVAQYVSDWGGCGGQHCLAGVFEYLPTGYDDYASIILTEKPDEPESYIFRATVRELPGVFFPRAILLSGGEDGCGSSAILECTIDSLDLKASGPYTGLIVATVTVRGVICGKGAELVNTQIEVVDHSGCIFDAGGEMEDYTCWAMTNMEYLSLDYTAEEGEMTPCHNAAINRCCAAGSGTYREAPL